MLDRAEKVLKNMFQICNPERVSPVMLNQKHAGEGHVYDEVLKNMFQIRNPETGERGLPSMRKGSKICFKFVTHKQCVLSFLTRGMPRQR